MQLLRVVASRVTPGVIREVVLALVLLSAAAVMVWGIASIPTSWAVPAARFFAGFLLGVLGALFLVEAD